jgi:hypothetical protein
MEKHPDFPEFAIELLKRQHCPDCRGKFEVTDICMQGHRKGRDGKWYYCFDTICRSCTSQSSTVVTSRPAGTQGLLKILAEMYSADVSSLNLPEEHPDKGGKSKITDDEVRHAKEIIEKADTFEELLRGFGVDEEAEDTFRKEAEEREKDAGQ